MANVCLANNPSWASSHHYNALSLLCFAVIAVIVVSVVGVVIVVSVVIAGWVISSVRRTTTVILSSNTVNSQIEGISQFCLFDTSSHLWSQCEYPQYQTFASICSFVHRNHTLSKRFSTALIGYGASVIITCKLVPKHLSCVICTQLRCHDPMTH